MSVYVPARLRRRVAERAGGRCEYCLLPGRLRRSPPEVDHVRPLKLGGRTAFANLALACRRCNAAKGTNIAAYDPLHDEPAFLFDPRRQARGEHFRLRRGLLVPLTASARATAALLSLNAADAQVLRYLEEDELSG